jgi:outer membrane protein TolC
VKRLLILVALLVGARAHASKYTLEALTARVTKDFPAIAAAREGVESAEAGVRAARFAWLPVGDLNFFITGSPNVKCLDKPYDPTDPNSNIPNPDKAIRENNCLRTNVVSLSSQAKGSSLIDIAPIHGVLMRLDVTLNQPLYSFGRIEAGIAIAEGSLAVARANLAKEEADAIMQASRAYFGCKAARAALATLDEGIGHLRGWIDKMNEQLDGKNTARYTESDLARLKVAMSFVMTQRYDQERNLAYTQRALQLLTGDLQADVDDADLELTADEIEPLEVWQTRARLRRPELLIARANFAVTDGVRQQRLAEMLPELTFNSALGVGYAPAIDTPQNYFFNRSNYVNATFGFMLHEPLDFGPRFARWRQARADAHGAEARGRTTDLNAAIEIAKAYEDWREARARTAETQRGERVSRGWFHAVDDNMQAGLQSDTREAVEAAQSYFAFRLRNLQAIFDANIALAWLQRVTQGVPKT